MSREENLVEIKQKEIEGKAAEIQEIKNDIQDAKNRMQILESSVKGSNYKTNQLYKNELKPNLLF